MKQIDKIKQMNAEEMAEFMTEVNTAGCDYCIGKCAQIGCTTGFKAWLESEVEE